MSEAEELLEDARAFLDWVASADSSEPDLYLMLERELLVAPTPDALDGVIENLDAFMGEEASRFLIHSMSRRDAGVPKADLHRVPGADPAVLEASWALILRLRRLFGHRATELVNNWRENGDDWRSIQPTVFRILDGEWVVRLELLHYGGGRSVVEGPPKSLLRLITLTLGVLTRIPSSDAFPARDLARLREMVASFEAAHNDQVVKTSGNTGGAEAVSDQA